VIHTQGVDRAVRLVEKRVNPNWKSGTFDGRDLFSPAAALLASAPDLAALRADYALQSAPEQDGLQWVLATPKARDGQLKSVRVGFEGERLAALDILDSFGQRSQIRFTGMQTNPALPAGSFQFKPPAGADVLKQ